MLMDALPLLRPKHGGVGFPIMHCRGVGGDLRRKLLIPTALLHVLCAAVLAELTQRSRCHSLDNLPLDAWNERARVSEYI